MPEGIEIAIDIQPQLIKSITPIPHKNQGVRKLLVVAYSPSILKHGVSTFELRIVGFELLFVNLYV